MTPPPPTLGNVAADWIEDMLGMELDDEEVRFLQHAYELRPTGTRRWRRAFLSRLKGFGKTHFAAAVADLEFVGPCRCDGFDARGEPVGVPAVAPAVYFAATEETQAMLGYDDAVELLREGRASEELDLDIGQTRTFLLGPGGGVLRFLSAGASSKEGYRPSFIAVDETWLFEAPPLKRFFITLLGGLPKRQDAWMMETSTSPAAGSSAVAAETLAGSASALERGVELPVFVDHRAASERWDITDRDGRREALLEAAGTAHTRVDLEYMLDIYDDPQMSEAEWRRRYLNQSVAPIDAWLPAGAWEACADTDRSLEPGDWITIGFDGSDRRDSTAVVAVRVDDGHAELLGLWEPAGGRRAVQGAEIDRQAVDATIARAMSDYVVVRAYFDPWFWQSDVARWEQEYRRSRVRSWPTNRVAAMVAAVAGAETAILNGEITHNGDPRLARHVANARRRERRSGHVLEKDAKDSPRRIDAAIALVLALEARRDVVASGEGRRRGGRLITF
jgi:phage terminase large subunit-like protein